MRPLLRPDVEALERPRFRAVTSEDTYVVAESLLCEDCVNRHNTVESRVFFVATDDGDVVGWTHLDLLQVDKLQSSAKPTIGVRESYRRHGVGSKLIERGTGRAEANGYRKLYNSVPSTRW